MPVETLQELTLETVTQLDPSIGQVFRKLIRYLIRDCELRPAGKSLARKSGVPKASAAGFSWTSRKAAKPRRKRGPL